MTRVIGLAWAGALYVACTAGTAPPSGSSASLTAQANTADAASASDAGLAGDSGTATCPGFNFYKNLYWGDLHTHTQYSADAYSFGNRNTPMDAYAFARGATEFVAAGDPTVDAGTHQLASGRELDFDAVTDHSEWLAATYGCGLGIDGGPIDPSSPFLGSGLCEVIQTSTANNNFQNSISAQSRRCDGGEELGGVPACFSETKSAWASEQQAAAAANDPCNFTSFVAYEWTFAPNGNTLHRNVIFQSDVVPEVPADSVDYNSPVELWQELDRSCLLDAGCDVITIPHNTNLSSGLAFDVPDMDAGALALQQRYQRLIEIHQHKGCSECFWNFDGGTNPDPHCYFEQKVKGGDADVPQSFVRYGLAKGLGLYAQTGMDAYQLGIVGATDDHDALPGDVAEDTWPGHLGQEDDTPAKRLEATWAVNNPGGLTAVWAEENTRPSLFAALKRRETMATSGPRIAVRLYQTWDGTDYCAGALPDGGTEPFPENIIDSRGVPMGGTMTLPPPAGSQGPYFTVSATKDVANLAEVDIIKLTWVDGEKREQVNSFTAFANPAAICMSWQDTAYDSRTAATYYVRVLQVPTWRWSHYDCLADPTANPAGCAPDGGLDVATQERAWTSPIWSLP
jgi:hypothetical protein